MTTTRSKIDLTPLPKRTVMADKRPEILAVFCSDLHLWHQAPVARSSEPDWFVAQERQLAQLREIARPQYNDSDGRFCEQLPIVVAGDVFDRYSANAETINWAIKHLPKCYAVSGQHDQPNHRLDDIRRSAYHTLVEAGVITDLKPDIPVSAGRMRLHGFPWGVEVKPLEKPHGLCTEIAVVHAMIWDGEESHPGVDQSSHVRSWLKRLKGYDVAVFGDNHKRFIRKPKREGEPYICNCGGFMRRRSDERDYEPAVGLLWSDGKVTRRKLDCTADKFLDDRELAKAVASKIDASQFIEEMGRLSDAAFDFREAVREWLQINEISPEGREALLGAMENGK